jgi:hypothetical protein
MPSLAVIALLGLCIEPKAQALCPERMQLHRSDKIGLRSW